MWWTGASVASDRVLALRRRRVGSDEDRDRWHHHRSHLAIHQSRIGLVVIAAAIAVPVTAYLMLDPSQRRRLRNIQRRREIDR